MTARSSSVVRTSADARRAHAGNGATIQQLATPQDGNLVADLFHLIEQMTRQDYGATAVGGQVTDEIAHFDDPDRVEPVGRLVQDQERRIAQQAWRRSRGAVSCR